MTSVKAYADRQHELFVRITRTVENLKKSGKDNISRHSIDVRLQLLDGNWEKFMATHEKLLPSRSEEKQLPYFTDDLFSQCEEAFCSVKTELLHMKDELSGPDCAALNASRSSATPHCTRALPKITLPRFSGDYQEWKTFYDLFSSMVIDNPSITPVERLHYLKSHVSGEAARLIANVPVTADNFDVAWKALVVRFDNKRMLVASYFDRLAELVKMSTESADALKSLLATSREVIGGLEVLKIPSEDAWELYLAHFVARRLDHDTLKAWELQLGSATEPATLSELQTFLEGRIRALELTGPPSSAKSSAVKSLKAKTPARANAAMAKSSRCTCCSASHFIAACPEFAKKSLADRREVVRTKRLCFNCLGEHLFADCRTVKSCRTCGERHHTLIHPDRTFPSAVTTQPPSSTGQPAISTSQVSPLPSAAPAAGSALSHSALLSPEQPDAHRLTTLLATARVWIAADSGELVEARALLDQGSELSFVAESLAQALRLPRRHAAIPIRGIGSLSAGSTRGVITLTVHSRSDNIARQQVSAYVLPKLTGRIPASRVRVDSWSHLRGLDLADPTFATPGRIDLVLGADVYGSLLRDATRQESPDSPVAQLTALGWIISGPARERHLRPSTAPTQQAFPVTPDRELAEVLSRFWQQEEVLPPSTARLTPEENECEQHFASTHSRTASGRYIVRLPFRTSPDSIGDSHAAALRMHEQMQRRFASDSVFADLYSEFMCEYEKLGHMQRATAPDESSASFVLPHHGVMRAGVTPRKIRVVFNGSMRSTSGASLNDCLHVGSKLQPDLADIILRWRRHQFVFLADIEKMYRQVLVHPLDRRFQRILWSRQGSPDVFDLCTVTYGLACALFLAQRTLRQVAWDERSRFPAAIDIVQEEMYVDDVLSGGDTVQHARDKAHALNQLLMAGGFPLHKWVTNYVEVLSDI